MVACAVVGPPTEPPRVAFAVGRKVAGGAVTRNRVRRRLRAATRAHAPDLEPGRAYLVTAVAGSAVAPYAELADSLGAALRALREEGRS